MKKRLLHILFWSVLSAAFIGPGTVTTAAAAGAEYGTALIWALVFSTLATVVLQESVARLRFVTGKSVGTLITEQFNGSSLKPAVSWLIFIAIFSGCAAYEAGNILGAMSGIQLFASVSRAVVTGGITVCAFMLLWKGSTAIIARTLGGIVAIMGLCFLYTVVAIQPELTLVAKGLIPQIPSGSSYLVLALIGTTVVPYNLFLGAGLDSRQHLGEMRFSLTIAVVLGGIISIAVLITGAAVTQAFSFKALYQTMELKAGWMGGYLLATGLAAAGLTSAVTAPFAASLTAQSLFQNRNNSAKWQENGLYFRLVWGSALAVGFFFGISGIRPIPAIILAQSLNGLILPFVAVYLYRLLNDEKQLGSLRNTTWQNGLMGIIVLVTIILGIRSLWSAINKLL